MGQPNPALKSSLILSFLRTPEPWGWRVGAGGCHPSWLEQLQPSAVLVSSKVWFLQDGCPRVGFLLLRSHPRPEEGGRDAAFWTKRERVFHINISGARWEMLNLCVSPAELLGRREKWLHGAELFPYPSSLACWGPGETWVLDGKYCKGQVDRRQRSPIQWGE